MDFHHFIKKCTLATVRLCQKTQHTNATEYQLCFIYYKIQLLLLKQYRNSYVFSDPKVLNNIYSHKNWQFSLLIFIEKKI